MAILFYIAQAQNPGFHPPLLSFSCIQHPVYLQILSVGPSKYIKILTNSYLSHHDCPSPSLRDPLPELLQRPLTSSLASYSPHSKLNDRFRMLSEGNHTIPFLKTFKLLLIFFLRTKSKGLPCSSPRDFPDLLSQAPLHCSQCCPPTPAYTYFTPCLECSSPERHMVCFCTSGLC